MALAVCHRACLSLYWACRSFSLSADRLHQTVAAVALRPLRAAAEPYPAGPLPQVGTEGAEAGADSPQEQPPKVKKEGKPKKEKGETPAPEENLPPPPPSEDAAPPPASPDGDGQPRAKKNGQPNKGKDKRDGGPPESCPDGTVPLEDGSCVTPQ